AASDDKESPSNAPPDGYPVRRAKAEVLPGERGAVRPVRGRTRFLVHRGASLRGLEHPGNQLTSGATCRTNRTTTRRKRTMNRERLAEMTREVAGSREGFALPSARPRVALGRPGAVARSGPAGRPGADLLGWRPA